MDHYTKFKIFFIFVICSKAILATAEDELEEQTSEVQQVFAKTMVTLDLAECTCTSTESACDLTIIRSPVLDINCLAGESLCCPITKSQEPRDNSHDASSATSDNTADLNETSSSMPRSNIRVYSISPPNSDQPIDYSPDRFTLSKLRAKKNCHCKARSSCPHKYIDYGFGFYCTYNTVRCCYPENDNAEVDESATLLASTTPAEETTSLPAANTEDDNNSNSNYHNETGPQQLNATSDLPIPAANNETIFESEDAFADPDSEPDYSRNAEQPQGELLITEVTNSWNGEDYQKELDCLCLPIQKCRLSNDFDTTQFERRRDTLCPGDLVQCCGSDIVEGITKKQDTDAEPELTHISQDYPPYHQPIQLPNLIVPAEKEGPHTSQLTTLPPPVLPIQYHSYEPNNYNNNRGYPSNVYPAQLSGPQSYQKGTYGNNGQNIRPWVTLSSPSSFSKYSPPMRNDYQHGYPRGAYTDEGRATKPGGLFESLKQMLG